MKQQGCEITTGAAEAIASRGLDHAGEPASQDWSALGGVVLSEAIRRTTDELLRREEAIARATRAGREVLS